MKNAGSTPLPHGKQAEAAGRSASTDDRLGRLYVSWRPAAIAMLTRAFGAQLDEHAREDAYASAWAASLSSLGERVEGMADAELRTYIFSAVTTHAGKELRRRGRKPIEPLDNIEAAHHGEQGPAESLDRSEERRMLMDVLTSLPERRRRVLTLRYALGLTPEEICEVMDGLSPRAYRKEITRGIKDLGKRLGLVESGEWCASLDGEVRAFAIGQAGEAGSEQVRAHLAHCATCSRTLRELSGSLHDLSLLPVSGILASSTAAATPDAGIGLIARANETVGAAASKAQEAESIAASISGSGGTRGGVSAVIAGAGAKIGALGVAGKVAVGCVGASAGLAACVASGVVPVSGVDGWIGNSAAEVSERDDGAGAAPLSGSEQGAAQPAPTLEPMVTIPHRGDHGERTAPDPQPNASAAPAPESANESTDPVPAIAPESVTPVERESAPEVAAATADGSGGGGGGSSGRATTDQAAAQLGTP